MQLYLLQDIIFQQTDIQANCPIKEPIKNPKYQQRKDRQAQHILYSILTILKPNRYNTTNEQKENVFCIPVIIILKADEFLCNWYSLIIISETKVRLIITIINRMNFIFSIFLSIKIVTGRQSIIGSMLLFKRLILVYLRSMSYISLLNN